MFGSYSRLHQRGGEQDRAENAEGHLGGAGRFGHAPMIAPNGPGVKPLDVGVVGGWKDYGAIAAILEVFVDYHISGFGREIEKRAQHNVALLVTCSLAVDAHHRIRKKRVSI
jgi:hypothetical protein